MFKIYCDKQSINVYEKEPLESGSQKIYIVEFKFSKDWDEFSKLVTFSARNNNDELIEKSCYLNEYNQCEIPWEVLAKPNMLLYVGIRGDGPDGMLMPTEWGYVGYIGEGSTISEETKEPTPDTYKTLIDIAKDTKEIAENVQNDMNEFKAMFVDILDEIKRFDEVLKSIIGGDAQLLIVKRSEE